MAMRKFFQKILEYIKRRPIIIWATVIGLLLPIIDNALGTQTKFLAKIAESIFGIAWPLAVYYLANYYLLVPKLLFKGKKSWYIICNVVPYIILSGWAYLSNTAAYNFAWKKAGVAGIIIFLIVPFIVYMAVARIAASNLYVKKTNKLLAEQKEKEKKATEAELAWLKNQLNPHFLFNTLNNISSLVQINPTAAQESISQLSELLRYALYDSNKQFVPLEGEIEFMENYVELMRLRCPERADIQADFQLPSEPKMILPLIYISLIENAFKHGLSNSNDSFVHISLHEEGEKLIFTTENTNYPKNSNNKSGSGIGIENLKRRLDLVYPKSYEFVNELRGTTYFTQLTIWNLHV